MEPPTNTIELLQCLNQMITDVNEVNGTNEKIKRLQKYSGLKSFLKMLYDPLQTTGVTSAQLDKFSQNKKKRKMETNNASLELEDLLQKLYNRDLSGDEAKSTVLSFISAYPDHKELIYKIIDKDLETRLDIKQLNKAFPGLIGEFNVALANDFQKGQKYFEKHKKDVWFISRKYDGIRCIVKVSNGVAQAFSRNGNRLPALEPLERLIQSACTTKDQDFVLDGEICVVDKNGTENFTSAVSSAKRKSVKMENFRYYVFDYLTMDQFELRDDTTVLSKRLETLQKFLERFSGDNQICAVEMERYSDAALAKWKTKSQDAEWEGLMLRMDSAYSGKRSNDLLKMKSFFDDEYEVLDCEFGTMRMIDPTTGLEKVIDGLKSVIIEHKGCKVHVGSGFTIDQRQEYFKNPENIIGKKITVQYFEEICDADGAINSLRFPTLKMIYDDERDT